MKTIFTLFVFSSLLMAQRLTVGVKGGAFLTDPAERFDQSRRYLVGPSIEVALPGRFAAEADAFYSRFGSSLASGTLSSSRTRGNSLEFPVLGKYYFAERSNAVQPFASVGMAFRNIWLDTNDSRLERIRISNNSSNLSIGAVAALGAFLKAGRFKFAPEVRYTRWGGSNFPATNPNQAEVLIGVHF